MSSNLPPGVSSGMLPGNTSEDAAEEQLYNDIAEAMGLDVDDEERLQPVYDLIVAREKTVRAEYQQDMFMAQEMAVGEYRDGKISWEDLLEVVTGRPQASTPKPS